ncbi:acyl-CoA thioesterase [Propionivibrio soli]|uniref:acyl-CoA thioesterase n=1 Tax=Propionivibrio soli TaxID=2976531 RepID=UPI0021E931D4|nr:acyl-CoA thioesterase [Propionivibrio soli]
MPRIFVQRFTVDEQSIDINGHVNNQEFVRWMQDVATSHSGEQGWPMKRYFAEGMTWVIRSHFIEYQRPAFLGDELLVVTWVAAMEARTSPRRYRFLRAADGKTVVEAETKWVFCDLRTGRPRDIPEAVRVAFPLVTDEEEVAATVSGLLASAQTKGTKAAVA